MAAEVTNIEPSTGTTVDFRVEYKGRTYHGHYNITLGRVYHLHSYREGRHGSLINYRVHRDGPTGQAITLALDLHFDYRIDGESLCTMDNPVGAYFRHNIGEPAEGSKVAQVIELASRHQTIDRTNLVEAGICDETEAAGLLHRMFIMEYLDDTGNCSYSQYVLGERGKQWLNNQPKPEKEPEAHGLVAWGGLSQDVDDLERPALQVLADAYRETNNSLHDLDNEPKDSTGDFVSHSIRASYQVYLKARKSLESAFFLASHKRYSMMWDPTDRRPVFSRNEYL